MVLRDIKISCTKSCYEIHLIKNPLFSGDASSVLFLLDHDCDANALTPDSLESPLHLAIRSKDIGDNVIQKLIAKGSQINAQNKDSM